MKHHNNKTSQTRVNLYALQWLKKVIVVFLYFLSIVRTSLNTFHTVLSYRGCYSEEYLDKKADHKIMSANFRKNFNINLKI